MSRGAEAVGYDALLARLFARGRGGAPRDPARTRRLLDRLHLPDPRNVVHVVGTNGKGSVAWRVDAGLRAAGLRSLRFLSPHVERFEERVAVDGVEVAPAEVRAFLARAWRDEREPRAAFFELCTALALDVAARRDASWAVLEAGVGAARDATIAVGNVRAVVITDVSDDHLEVIGPDLAAVARDKAAAIRPGVPLVTGARGEALAILRETATARGAPLRVVDDACEEAGDRITGLHAALAASALRALARTTDALPPDRLEAALAAAARRPALPARRERFERDGRTVLLDGAHNAAATAALADAAPPGHHLLLGVLARKDPARVGAPLLKSAARVTLTAAEPHERPWGDDPRFVPDATDALARALQALPEGGTLVATGSLHLAGALRPSLRAWEAEGAAP